MSALAPAVRSELRKLTSTRLWWVLAGVMAAYMVFLAVVMAFAFTSGDEALTGGMAPDGEELARVLYSLASPLGYVFPLIIGTLLFTGEFRHQTITASLLAAPSRTTLMVAKFVLSAGVGLLFGLIGTAATVIGAAPFLAWRGDGTYLTAGSVLTVLVTSVLVMAVWSMFGTAIGSVLTNQIAAIVVILAFTQFVEPVARLALSAWDATSQVARFLPGAAADAMLGASLFAQDTSTDLLSKPVGAVVLLAYVVALAMIGRLVTLRRDIG